MSIYEDQIAAKERTRIKTILSCDEAKGRESSAEHLAWNTSVSVADAKTALAGIPSTASAAAQFDLGRQIAKRLRA